MPNREQKRKMPIPKNWTAPRTNKEFPALPPDVYQVFIEDVDIVQTKAYQSEEMIWQLKFTFQVLDEAYKKRKVWKYVTPVISAGSDTRKPANFNLIYEAVFEANPTANNVINIDANVVNSFIGKQLRLTLRKSTTHDGREVNKIESYLPVKSPLPLPEDWKRPEAKEHVEGYDIPIINEDEESPPVDFGDIEF
jgi:hypothetical protein